MLKALGLPGYLLALACLLFGAALGLWLWMRYIHPEIIEWAINS